MKTCSSNFPKEIYDYSILNLAINKKVEVHLKKANDGYGPVKGLLMKVQGDLILIDKDKRQDIIPINNIAGLEFIK